MQSSARVSLFDGWNGPQRALPGKALPSPQLRGKAPLFRTALT